MSILQAIVLGMIQGIGEFLPISSSGHLIFLPKMFGWQDQGLAFDMVLHLGTLVAVIFYFRKKLLDLFQSIGTTDKKHQTDRRLIWLVGVSTIPAGLVGLLVGDFIEQEMRSTAVIGVSLIVWGIVLGLADLYQRKQKKKRTDTTQKELVKELSWWQAMTMGCAQALALIPGTSRSGITMTAGLFSGLTREAAAEFSFLMSIPIIALAAGSKVIGLVQNGFGQVSGIIFAVGFVSAALSGVLAIAALMKIIQRWSFLPFVGYRILIGIAILAFL